MDYTVVDSRAETLDALLQAVMSVFESTDAEVLEIITSSQELERAARRYALFKVGKGMSFKYSVPASWGLDRDAADIGNWDLTHYCGDAFSFA